MNKVKVLSIVSIGLFAANIILIWFLMTNKTAHDRKEGPKKIIIEKLQFNEVQTAEYEKLIDWHKENIRKQEQQMMVLKNQLYTSLQQNKQTNSTDSLIAEIGKVQIEIEYINYKHFKDIKELCKPEQLELFDELCEDIAKLFAHKPLPPNEK
jgi:periplasmic protein CpxP/Spy